ncbi:hypothetical protein CI109_103500 [Kwoniella shandongensis]|uniref:Vacuolar protein sorting-associated protein 27 n=1 Tax=Kwoniella shandongensis TaxID=1734106 RepID=A0A5M6BWJ2_9TREE|nr:uncharacterized protein CI109_004598 [Kwoniella shandongensis]KAA5527063.1 hypothetical protein CI109_004598 [Kwoniella shandongensis]
MSWLWGASTNPQFEELSEKACSPLNLPYPQSEDIATALEITDMIRSKAVLPKMAMQSLKRRIASKNGRVQMYAIGLTDTCIKNGGDHFLAEIASKEFVDEVSGLIKSPVTNPEVKQMLLKNFQQWALAFESKRELGFFVDIYKELKNSGVAFPPPPAPVPSHLLTTTTAPAWVDSDVCMRCRSAFTFTNRKHHCRNCGLVFDQACSSRTMALPKFGIAEEVRVCESCWVKSGKGKNESAPAIPGRTPRSRADLDADLQRAIELSLAESQPGGSNFIGSEPPLARKNGSAEEDDEELRLAIEASLRDMERARPSAPTGLEEPEFRPLPTFDLAPRETETVVTFSNTMDQMAAYGERDLRRFPHAHILAEQAYAIGEKLRRNVEEKSTKQQMLSEMQDKLSQAVGLYGQILDGQQAFAARRLQEEQQRQYQQQQQRSLYSYAPPQQYPNYVPQTGYAPPNGYGQYVPPQPTYQPPQQSQQPAVPSLYPTMPYAGQTQGQPIYAPPQVYAQQPYRQETTSPLPFASSPSQYAPQQQPWAAAPSQPNLARHTSLHIQPVSAAVPSALQRQVSMTYGAPPEPSQYHAQEASAPPPLDMTTHPSSPTASIHQPLPVPAQSQNHASAPTDVSSQSSYVSPTPVSTQLSSSPSTQQHLPPQQQQQWDAQGYDLTPSAPHAQPPQQQQQQYQPSHPQQQQQQPAQPQQQQWQQPQSTQQLPPGVYSASSFPQALPATIFPDAPIEAPKGLEKEEKEEALLIEL